MTDTAAQQNINVEAPQHLGCYFGTGVKLVFSQGKARLKLPIARLGTFVHPKYGTVDFNQRDFDEMTANFESNAMGFTPWLRYGHSILPDHIEKTLVDHQPKIGNLLYLSQEGSVLFGFFEPLKDQVVTQVKNREYEGASCEVLRGAMGKDGSPIGTVLMAHALTNSPFVPNMPALQVLSLNGSTASCEVLDMTHQEGEPHMDFNQLLSQLASGEATFESLSVSQETIDALRKRLSSADAVPTMDTELPPGTTGTVADKYSAAVPTKGKDAEGASTLVTGLPAGTTGTVADKYSTAKMADEKCSTTPNPFAMAGEALKEKGADEKNSLESAMELLSAIAPFFKKKGADAKKDAQKFSASAVQTKEDSAPKEAEKFSAGAAPTGETPTDKENTDMDMNEIIAKASLAATEAVSQKFSVTIEDQNKTIKELTDKLTQAETALNATQTEAQKFSVSLVETSFNREWDALVAEGIPAAVVAPLKEVARLVRGNVQKFSNGQEQSLDQAMLAAMRNTPGHLRVSYEQQGQQFSVGAGNPGVQSNASSVFGDVVPGLKA